MVGKPRGARQTTRPKRITGRSAPWLGMVDDKTPKNEGKEIVLDKEGRKLEGAQAARQGNEMEIEFEEE